MLQAQKYYIYDFEHNYQTPLLIAISKGNTDLAKRFVELGSDLDAVDINGKSCLYYSLINKTDIITTLLLENFADPFGKNGYRYDNLTNNP